MNDRRRAEITTLARTALIRAWRPDSGVWSLPSTAARDLLPIPVDRIARTIFGLNVVLVQSLPCGTDGLEPVAALYFDRNRIEVVDTLPLRERAFSVAHEIGHFEMHAGSLPRVYRERLALGHDLGGWRRPPMEREADWYSVTLTILCRSRWFEENFKPAFTCRLPSRTLMRTSLTGLRRGPARRSRHQFFAFGAVTISGISRP